MKNPDDGPPFLWAAINADYPSITPFPRVAEEWAKHYTVVKYVPVSSVVPISRLREWIEKQRNHTRDEDALDSLAALLDDVECASNPNNERTNDAS